MQVVNIIGSPRKNGNSATMARTLCERLGGAGATVVTHHLNSLQIKGCQGCEACKKSSEKCVVRDDLAQVLDDIAASEVVVVSTPVYWGEISGQLKCCIDRFYSFLKPGFMQGHDVHRLPPGKLLVFLQSQGAPEKSQFADIFPRYNAFFSELQLFAHTWQLTGCGLSERAAAGEDQLLLDEVRTLAEEVLARVNG